MISPEHINHLQNTSPLRLTIGGDIGAGKSTCSKRLAKELDLPRISIGHLMREEAAKRGISLDELNRLMEQDDEVDRYMDALQKTRSQEIERGVFEGRLAWYFVIDPKIKIFLSVDPEVAAERIWQDDNALRDTYDSIEALKRANIARKQSEETRYHQYYDITAYDHENYDIVVDTTKLTIDEVFETVLNEIIQHLQINPSA